jgi:hypothetical protein
MNKAPSKVGWALRSHIDRSVKDARRRRVRRRSFFAPERPTPAEARLPDELFESGAPRRAMPESNEHQVEPGPGEETRPQARLSSPTSPRGKGNVREF